MAIVLDRAEFYTLASLFRAEEIIGLDAEALIPTQAAEQQALYDRGREQLRERELLRINARQEVELEQGLRDLMATVVNPENALLVVRSLPELGRQLFLYYERGHVFVEQTLPDDHSHRLGLVGDHDALVARLLELFPVTAAPFAPDAFTVATNDLLQAYQLAGEGQAERARAVLEAARSSNAALATQMAEVFAHAAFSGNISLLKLVPGRTTRSHDIALAQGPDGAWGITGGAETDTLRVERMNATVLRETLRRALIAMDQPLN
ncbi:MAG: hypothetical protein JNL73_24280 [Anaerolineales bacterium]|nr:hypothetical protein [Anaerolineales bacterium]